MSNSQLNKLKSGISGITSNVFGDSNELRKAFANTSSANIKLFKTQLHKIGQSGGFLGRPLGPLLKSGLPLIGKLLKPFAKKTNLLFD